MNDEIQVALNFLISFLYNKLPRRRVNQFGEELELIIRNRFDGHWYPDEPSKGSAYRCIHCNPQLDSSLFREAAHNSGLNLQDVQQNLPVELSIWIDPGEVSYRISEKGPVNILYSVKRGGGSSVQQTNGLNPESMFSARIAILGKQIDGQSTPPSTATTTTTTTTAAAAAAANNKNEAITFTTAAFAATKFGSTKPKVSIMNKKQFQQNRILPTDGQTTKFMATSRKLQHFKPISRTNSFNSNNGQPFPHHCQPLLSNCQNGQPQQIMDNQKQQQQQQYQQQQQQQQKMRQLIRWNNGIKSGFDRDHHQPSMAMALFEQQSASAEFPASQTHHQMNNVNSFDVLHNGESNMTWNTNQQPGFQRSISLLDNGNVDNGNGGGGGFLLDTFMSDKLLREIFEMGDGDDQINDSNDDNLMMMFSNTSNNNHNNNQSPPELISPSSLETILPPLPKQLSSCWSSSSSSSSTTSTSSGVTAIMNTSSSSSPPPPPTSLLNILSEFDNLSLNSTSESSSSSIGSIASYVQ
nr:LOW QUALITY PROTEIN: protein Tob1-like [Dermatophagoides farinae]